jgi:predicted transcriptional regulator of viral defense system
VGLDAKSDRAGWLPAVSYYSALLCHFRLSGLLEYRQEHIFLETKWTSKKKKIYLKDY